MKRGERTRRDHEIELRHRGRCTGPVTHCPAIGSVGADYSADCPTCSKRVRVTKRGRFAHHKPMGSLEAALRSAFRMGVLAGKLGKNEEASFREWFSAWHGKKER